MSRKSLRFKPSHKDVLRANDAAVRFLAAGRPVPPELLNNVAPKRKRAQRTLASGPSEHQLQVAVIQWWNRVHAIYGVPAEALFAIPNGGARDVITGARLKAEGVRRGIPDLMLAMRCHARSGLFIEMKVGSNKLSEHQSAFATHLLVNGYAFATCYTSERAIQAIVDYIGA